MNVHLTLDHCQISLKYIDIRDRNRINSLMNLQRTIVDSILNKQHLFIQGNIEDKLEVH